MIMEHILFCSQLLFIGTTELLLICAIALLLFGGKKLPEMMRGLGQGVREFKKGVNEASADAPHPNDTEDSNQAPSVEGQQGPNASQDEA